MYENNNLKCWKLFKGNSMLIRLLFIQRNAINSNYFLAILNIIQHPHKFLHNPCSVNTYGL